MITLNPYLNFDSKSAEAMKWYQSILGGELTISTFGDAGVAKTPEQKDLTMHANLKSGSMTIMASDGNPERPPIFGNNIHLSLVGDDATALTNIFTKLSEGGTVNMPLAEQMWGDTFGMVKDKFGINWMVNIAKAK